MTDTDRALRDTLEALRGDIGTLTTCVGHLDVTVKDLSGRVHGVETRQQADDRTRARRAERAHLIEDLRARGVVIPPEVVPTLLPVDNDDEINPGAPIPRATRESWARDLVDLAGSAGGRRILGTVVTLWVTAWLGPEAGRAITAYLQPPSHVTEVDLQLDTLPDAQVDSGLEERPAWVPGPPRPTL